MSTIPMSSSQSQPDTASVAEVLAPRRTANQRAELAALSRDAIVCRFSMQSRASTTTSWRTLFGENRATRRSTTQVVVNRSLVFLRCLFSGIFLSRALCVSVPQLRRPASHSLQPSLVHCLRAALATSQLALFPSQRPFSPVRKIQPTSDTRKRLVQFPCFHPG